MDLPESLVRTAARQCGVLTTEQLSAGGFSVSSVKYRVSTGWFRRVGQGVVALAGSEDSWEQRACAASLIAYRSGGCASHRLAARYWQLRTVDDEIEVSVRYPKHLRIKGVIVHRSADLAASDVTWADGIPLTTVERTIVDLGLIFPEPEVLRILRHAIATDTVTRADIERLRYRVGKSGRDGAGVSGRCLDQLPVLVEQTESGAEALFLQLCEQHGLVVPDLQHPVIAGGRRYRLDFAYPAQRVFVEIDGVAEHSGPRQIAADGGRQNDLVAAGWQPLRFTYQLMQTSPDYCADQVRRVLAF